MQSSVSIPTHTRGSRHQCTTMNGNYHVTLVQVCLGERIIASQPCPTLRRSTATVGHRCRLSDPHVPIEHSAVPPLPIIKLSSCSALRVNRPRRVSSTAEHSPPKAMTIFFARGSPEDVITPRDAKEALDVAFEKLGKRCAQGNASSSELSECYGARWTIQCMCRILHLAIRGSSQHHHADFGKICSFICMVLRRIHRYFALCMP